MNKEPTPKRSVGAPIKVKDGRKVNLYLDPRSLAIASEVGQGNISEGVRRALARCPCSLAIVGA